LYVVFIGFNVGSINGFNVGFVDSFDEGFVDGFDVGLDGLVDDWRIRADGGCPPFLVSGE
jgi:hypothetical protein